jgi:hypothetical protein
MGLKEISSFYFGKIVIHSKNGVSKLALKIQKLAESMRTTINSNMRTTISFKFYTI